MTYSDFEARWKPAGGAERANYGLFLQDLCDLLEVPRPDPTTDDPTQDQYVLERAVQFNDGPKKSTGRIDLYKRGCFVLETKQGTDTADQQQKQQRAELGLEPSKRRKGHAVRGSAKWAEMMQAARQQALGYVRALPADEPRPLFVLVADVGYCIDVYSNFAGVGDSFNSRPRYLQKRPFHCGKAVFLCLLVFYHNFITPPCTPPSTSPDYLMRMGTCPSGGISTTGSGIRTSRNSSASNTRV
ncbi:type IIL restriction-modification enzyme MmeI [Hymenobacter endophyticus]|uniref:Type IIL restriction-modification enzyme MmeI n=1 Tax=Hymenobacter endophyticus TaxID=3076335 RepID=A0ABU3TL83_9BACT|nr:type IIL restriction-modification enzyme MmeI [Hymenobacter endophyticus]MDU0372123.1 type IIL restriction-modification enzyme MmeI [Hymenobacter endophyticus]